VFIKRRFNNEIGEITSEHSERSGDFNLEDYLKFREKAPDYSEEEGNEEGVEGEEGEEGEEKVGFN